MNAVSKLRVAFSAGEPSGDEHLARVARALCATGPCELRGMGGRAMRELGSEILVDCEKDGSLMGFLEVALAARQVLRSFSSMVSLLKTWKPHILVLVDYADFNLRLAARAHSLGIKVFYYITPQVWAWRSGRIRLFSRFVDRAAVIFPFEPKVFERGGYHEAVFVGHPFSDSLILGNASEEVALKERFYADLSLDPQQRLLALFPGSRPSEIARLLPTALETSRLLRERRSDVQVCLGVAPAVATQVRNMSETRRSQVRCVEGRSLELLRHCDAALLKSGTSNLQAVFLNTPCSMFFRAPLLSRLIVHSLVKIKEYSIVNIIRSGSIRELLQEDATPESLATEAESLLFDETRRNDLISRFAEIRSALQSFDQLPIFEGCKNSAERTSRLILDTAGV